MLFIVVKLFGMQLFSGGVYRRASEQNSVRIVPISAPRGLIKDKNGTILVKNRPSYSMYLVPYEVKNLDSASFEIAVALGENPDEIKNRINQGWKGRFQHIRLKRDVDFKTVCGRKDPIFGWYSPAYGIKIPCNVLTCLKHGTPQAANFKTLIAFENPFK